ncbi:MAG: PEGA domain-containing protein [Deltaproteobacteria bacterium]|nr:PEGA domain-containing protein [Deltaproteobacteria bacterium]
MKPTDKSKKTIGTSVKIKPVSFRPEGRHRGLKTSSPIRWIVSAGLALVLIVLCTSAWFVFTARQVIIRIEPQPADISIQGGIAAPKFGGHYLLRPGGYRLKAERQCFQLLEKDFTVTDDKSQDLIFTMEKQPGLLSFKAHHADKPSILLEGAAIFVDGQQIGQTPGTDLKLKAGRRSLVIRAEKYQDIKTEIEVDGCGVRQAMDLALVPGWADIAIDSIPSQARLTVNGQAAGITPLTIELPAGEHELVLTAEKFKPWRQVIAVQANQPRTLDIVRLQPADGILTVLTKPAGANVMLNGNFAGQTPLELKIAAKTQHSIHLYKAGYEKANRKVKLGSQESKTVTVALKPKLGVINFAVKPAGAEILINGKSRGAVPPQLRLVAVEHQIEIKKKGYQSYRTRITPRPGFPQEIRISLTNPSAVKKSPGAIIRAKNGYELKLIRPAGFTMGSSRREQGRRSNETLRIIQLQRPFYIGLREVTNREFRQFSAGHNSGKFKTHSLNRPELPVAGITWEQAALFCNWLSAREALPPVYVIKGAKLAAANPVGPGYRLPTEAEWEYCTRFNKKKANLKYPWGNKYPPAPQTGNFADESARDLLSSYLAGYNDGYPVIAPPAKFKANALGLYDLGGNAAEWCHDYYSIYAFDSQKVYKDPSGSAEGKHHIVRDSSWRLSGISALRSSYRDYSDDKRLDLGFRVVRYLE